MVEGNCMSCDTNGS